MIEDDSTIAFAVKTYLNKHNIETIIYNNLSQTENLNFTEVYGICASIATLKFRCTVFIMK